MTIVARSMLDTLRKRNGQGNETKQVVVKVSQQGNDFYNWEEGKPTREMFDFFGSNNPYDAPRDGQAHAQIDINDRKLTSFCTYNYLGLNGHPDLVTAVHEAAKQYGTSASASRIAGGDCSIHRDFEAELAEFVGCEDATSTVGGYIANVATISFIVGREDLILYDEYCHNSIVVGCTSSNAKRMQFRHQDYDQLNDLLKSNRHKYRRCLIVVESVYSMDGDIADLPKLIELRDTYNGMLMVDEAHSLGTLGKTGRGICEYFGVDAKQVDILMATLSKSFASCGGVILGSRSLTAMLRYRAQGFHLYSAGLPPTSIAAAQAALKLIRAEPERISKLQENADKFREILINKGLDVGVSKETSIIPVFVSSAYQDMKGMAMLNRRLFQNNIHVIGLTYPVVPRNESRLRFFVSSLHNESDFEHTATIVSELLQGT